MINLYVLLFEELKFKPILDIIISGAVMKLAASVILGLLSFSGGILGTSCLDLIDLNITVCHSDSIEDKKIFDQQVIEVEEFELLEVNGLDLIGHLAHGDRIHCHHTHH